jgi:hypothetical protein
MLGSAVYYFYTENFTTDKIENSINHDSKLEII